jgi:N-acylneuraminate cytidylyltransferase/CMP-N,N'-diacetyllegionaminic acid synthase
LLRDRTFLPPGTHPYIMPPERSLDVDSPWDFYLAELILRNRQ